MKILQDCIEKNPEETRAGRVLLSLRDTIFEEEKKLRIFKVSKLNGFTVVLQDLWKKMFQIQFFISQ